mmetsp:Transcript_28223/g.47483  ORF Transcript_28223/g.47483 Transcript_28223/m.47483 type:complete len:234 (+) Transcript_28223:78-779(+)
MAGVRRTWDKDYYEKKAKERSELGDDYVDKDEVGPAAKARKVMKEEFQQADSGAAGPMGSERAFLKARVGKLELDNKVGKTEVINPTSAGDYRGAGFWCEVCSCLLKDSSSYVDHINGKKHQRALGFSMRVERADVSSVKSRMEELKRKVANKSSSSSQPRVSALEAYNARLQSDMEAKESLKQRLKQQAEERKREKKETETAEKEAQEDEGGEEEDDEFKAMMGFSGFGTSK